ncbi:MAG: single-stranded DNA-binding protein [Candidatus Moraniibacteriota bacterium]
MNLNKAEIIGRVTKDPELRTMQNGTSVASFGVATNFSYNSKGGEKVERVSFHNCTLFGKGAEIFSKYVTKGQEVYVCGRLEYQEFQKKDGTQGSKTVIMVDDFQFGQKPKGYQQGAVDESSQPEPDSAEEVVSFGEKTEEIKIEDAAF